MSIGAALANALEELYRERIVILARLYKCERLIKEIEAAKRGATDVGKENDGE